MEVKNDNNGITLLALVITIIVLLILAGISMNLLLSDNGLLAKAKSAKTMQDVARLQEALELEKGSVQVANDGNVNLESYLKQIQEGEKPFTLNWVEELDDFNAEIVDADNNNLTINSAWNSTTHLAKANIQRGANVSKKLIIQYQIKAEGEEVNENDWQIGKTIENLKLNDIVYARLWNGVEGGKYIYSKIEDNVAPVVSTQVEVVDTKVRISMEGQDLESGIASYEIYIDSEKYKTIENANEQETIEFDSSYGNKEFYVIAKDKAGNHYQTENKQYKVTGELVLYSNGVMNEEILGGYRVEGPASLSYEGKNEITATWNKTTEGEPGGSNIYSKKLITQYKGLSKIKIKYSYTAQNIEWGHNNCWISIRDKDKNEIDHSSIIWDYTTQSGNPSPVYSKNNEEFIYPVNVNESFYLVFTIGMYNKANVNLKIHYISFIYE